MWPFNSQHAGPFAGIVPPPTPAQWCADCEAEWQDDELCPFCGKEGERATFESWRKLVRGSATPEMPRTRLEDDVLQAMRRGEWP